MHLIHPLAVASMAALVPVLLLASCSSQKAGQQSSSSKELDVAEAHYEANSRQVVERDHFEVLDSPELVLAGFASSLQDDEDVLGVVLGGDARAYPIGALGKSELVNDVCGGVPIAASW